MATRDELKALIDQLQESRLELVRVMLEHHVHPPQPKPRDRAHATAVMGV